jgi:hypothetical protein
MRKLYTLIGALALMSATVLDASACHYSSFTLDSHVDLGGGLHQYTVTFCAGSGPGGAVGQTGTWGIALDGGATFHSFPNSITSPNTQAVYGADNVSYGPEYLVYDAISWPLNSPYFFPNAWTCLEGNCGPAAATCVTFTYVTVGQPVSMTLMGAEGAGVGVAPYGCNGEPDMVITIGAPLVNAGTDVQLCAGACATLNPAVSGGAAPYTYSWYSLQQNAVVGSASALTVCPTQSGQYRLTVTDNLGRSSSDDVSVTVHQLPVANAGTDKLIYRGYGATCVSLSGAASGGAGPYSFAWSNGASTAAASVCPIVTTTYTLSVTDSQGCSASDAAVVTVRDIRCGTNKVSMCRNGKTSCVSTSQVPSKLNQGFVLGACGSFRLDGSEEAEEELVEALGTSIFPNPAAEQVTVQYGYDADAQVTIEVYDMSGRKVQTVVSNGEVTEGELNRTTFSVSDYRAGLYMIAISSSKGDRETHRLMVNH